MSQGRERGRGVLQFALSGQPVPTANYPLWNNLTYGTLSVAASWAFTIILVGGYVAYTVIMSLRAQRAGIHTIYQELSLVPSLSVAENIFLGQLPRRAGVSVDWQGYVYDCDFNQMLGLPLVVDARRRVRLTELAGRDLAGNPIAVRDHCFGCTAGQGSSCGGALAA